MDQQELKQAVLDFTLAHRKAVVATVGDDQHPTTSLMLYVIDEHLNFYFGTRKAFKKYEIMMRHPYISLSVIEENIDPLRVVEVRGQIEFVPEEKTAEMLAFFESKNQSKYYVKGAEDFIMFKVKPNFVRWLDATSGELKMEHLDVSLL